MKKIALSVLVCLFTLFAHAQELQDVGKIALAVTMPDAIKELDDANLSKLEIKVAQIVTTSGLASAGYTPNFTIYPQFTVNETSVVEGGMQNITLVTASLTLFIKQVDNNIIVSSVSKYLKGSGTTKSAAISNAIAGISPGDQLYKTFIAGSKQKIIAYYDSRCEDLMTLAENMVIKQSYEEALAILMSVPIEAKECYKKAQWKSNYVYTAYQNKICGGLMHSAQIKLATNQYNDALDLLAQVDPSSSCGKEALQLIKTTAAKVTAQEKKEWDLAVKVYDDQITLEKHRIDAIKEVAIAVMKKQPRRSRRRDD